MVVKFFLRMGKDGTHYCGDIKVVCSLRRSGEHGRKGAFVAFGNNESFSRNMVMGHGPYCEEGLGPSPKRILCTNVGGPLLKAPS